MRNRFYLPTRKTYKFKNYTRHFCFFIKLLYQDAINNHPLDSSRSIIFSNVSRTRRIIPPKLLARIYTHTHIIYNIHNTHIYISFPISRRQTGEHKSRQPSKHSNLAGVFDSIFARSSSVFTPTENSFPRHADANRDGGGGGRIHL